MNIQFLKKVIESYKLCQTPFVEDEQERINDEKNCEQALSELQEIERLIGPKDSFDGDCYILHAETVIDFMNLSTYDAYGKLYAENNGTVDFDTYMNKVRQMYGCDYAPRSVIELGYDTVGDLYRDNEALGNHNPDGTFNHNGNN